MDRWETYVTTLESLKQTHPNLFIPQLEPAAGSSSVTTNNVEDSDESVMAVQRFDNVVEVRFVYAVTLEMVFYMFSDICTMDEW